MTLTNLISKSQVKSKFNSEFYYPIKSEKSFYRKFNKKIIGLSIFRGKNNKIIICDSNGRYSEISALEHLIDFLTYWKYSSCLCCFNCAKSDFLSIISYLPEDKRNKIYFNQEIEYYNHIIALQGKKHLRLKKIDHKKVYDFYNIYSYVNTEPNATIEIDLGNDIVNTSSNKIKPENQELCDHNIKIIIDRCIDEAFKVKKIAHSYVNNSQPYNLKIINEPQTKNYNEIGTAFDYLLRFKLVAENKLAISNSWIAYKSLKLLNKSEKKKANEILKESEKYYSSFLKNKIISDDLIRSALYLAKLDGLYRGGFGIERINFGINYEDIEDLKHLISGVPEKLFSVKKVCILNPSFGPLSDLVGGADADLFIDNTLIDIKTTKTPEFSRNHFNQLMGYVLLHQLGQNYLNDSSDEYIRNIFGNTKISELENTFLNEKIERIGIYFSRSNYLHTIEIKEIIPEGRITHKYLSWFKQICIDYYNYDI